MLHVIGVLYLYSRMVFYMLQVTVGRYITGVLYLYITGGRRSIYSR